jgi:peptidoglycan/xylan/chitin deacetylase (PgdA/CDA1 family)
MIFLRRVTILLLCGLVAAPALAQTCPDPQALGTSRVLEINPAGGLKVGLKSYPQTLALQRGEVVLTFDDGPLPATTGPILKALREECVRATFFLVGHNAQTQGPLLRRALADGHTLAHHTMTHPHVTLRGLPPDRALEEITAGFQADDKAAYGQASSTPRVPFFRYPGFADTPHLNNWAADHGVAIFGADLWASDWQEMSPQQTMELLLQRLDVLGKGIILLHDTRPQTAKMVPALLRALKAKGYRIVHIVPGAQVAPLETASAGWRSETEANIAQVNKRQCAQRSSGQRPMPAAH